MTASSSYPIVSGTEIGWVTEDQMIEVDRVMIEDLGIGLIQMMENAGRNLARATIDLFGPSSVTVACGSGGNGGGGMVAARHMANAGVAVSVVLTRDPGDLKGVPAQQLSILQRMGVPIVSDIESPDVVVDAVIGYSLRGAPSGRSAELIDAINAGLASAVSLDIPSGLGATDGDRPGVVVKADATVTLCLPKTGMRGSGYVGRPLVADISVPRAVTDSLGGAPNFAASPILLIDS